MLKYVLLGMILIFVIVAAVFLVVYLIHASHTKNNYNLGKMSVKDGVDTENGIYKMDRSNFFHNESDTVVTANKRIFSVSLFNMDKNISYGNLSLYNDLLLGSSVNESNICIQGDRFISKKHCCLFLKNMIPYVRDVGSKNGTFLNSERITTERMLHDNDVIKIGHTHIRVNIF